VRIHRIHLQHVAGVDDRELTFGDGVTVVVGPNEAGKSTIPTALQLLLEEKDRYDNADIRSIRPVHVDEDPTIELECTTGPYHLTYRKCFGSTPKRRETSLTVHEPRPESLTGDAAHDRMTEILDETVDEQLWAALRVQQRHDIGQADLTESGALAAALDAAGTGSSALSEDGSLVTRVEEAAAEFWTDTGKARKSLTKPDAEVDTAHTTLETARAELRAVEGAVEQHDRLTARLAGWRSNLSELERRAKETAEAVATVDVHRLALAAAERDALGPDDGDFTEKLWALETRIFRPDPAPCPPTGDAPA
jgi:DNA repair ATPase RecN